MRSSLKCFFFAVCLLGAATVSRADTFNVTFFADFDFVIHNGGLSPVNVNGSFTWDTVAQTFSNANVTDSFGDSLNTLRYAKFFDAGNVYGFPAGTMAGFDFCGTSDCIQFSPGDHAFEDPQVFPQPGTYPTGMWFFDNSASCGCDLNSYGLTVAPVATPEPAAGLLFLLALPFSWAYLCRRKTERSGRLVYRTYP